MIPWRSTSIVLIREKVLRKLNKACKFYSYQRVVESYIRKEGKPVEYQRTADDTKLVKYHISYQISLSKIEAVNTKNIEANSSTVFPMMKDVYNRKFIELEFSQNLTIWPKLKVQSAHFSNKQYTLHCAMAKPFDKRYHYHLSDDTKHDGIFVEQVLRAHHQLQPF